MRTALRASPPVPVRSPSGLLAGVRGLDRLKLPRAVRLARLSAQDCLARIVRSKPPRTQLTPRYALLAGQPGLSRPQGSTATFLRSDALLRAAWKRAGHRIGPCKRPSDQSRRGLPPTLLL